MLAKRYAVMLVKQYTIILLKTTKYQYTGLLLKRHTGKTVHPVCFLT